MAENNNNTNGQVTNGQVVSGAPQGDPAANGTAPVKPEKKETLKEKASRVYNKEISFTPKKVVTTTLKIIGGVAAVIGIAGYAYNKGQNDALAIQTNEAYPELPDNTGDTDSFDTTGEDATAFVDEPDTSFENEPMSE